jgi:hypothetical protein
MSQDVNRTNLEEQRQQLVDGPLKHIRVAALAAALVPLAMVVATPASAQTTCSASGGVCGTVFNDTNNNGIQDVDEPGIEQAKVFICDVCDGTDSMEFDTNPDGSFTFSGLPPGTFTVSVLIPTGTQASPTDVGVDDTIDSDGTSNGMGFSVTTVEFNGFPDVDVDFGFFTPPPTQQSPGTGTPGYWKNHPEAWPAAGISIGGQTYTIDQAIAWMSKPAKDRTVTMFSALVSAKLNVMIGNDDSCVSSAISAGDAWMASHPVGSGVAGGSAAWAEGDPIHQTLDAYNNGLLCAPHRQ